MMRRDEHSREEGNTPLWSTIAYDHYGRVDEQVAADSTKTEYDYGALWQKVTISKGSVSRSSEVLTNALGETIESKDPMGNVVYSSYYPDGRLKESYTSVHPAHKTRFTYDAQGNRTSITDPDAGTVTSLYDSFGKLLQEINAKGNTTTFEYDKLGRVIKASDARGEINYMYISDTTDAAFGQADSIYHTDGSLYESFAYDDTYGRMLRSTRHLPGKTFTNSYTYDWFGRLWTRTYPSGFEVQYAYTDGGHLEQITGEGKTIWSCNDVNELGQITSYSQGSYSTTVDFDPFGVLEQITTGSVFNMEFGFDDLGNLTSREDVLTSQKEVFDYDNLNRLTGIDYYLNDIHQSSYDLDIGYNNDGNISSKTDVGATLNYGEGNAGPHALTSVESPVSGYEPPPQVTTYTCFNKVSTIQDTIAQDTTLTLAFTYGINNQRVKTVLSRNSTIERIKYFDGDYEEDSTSAGTKKYHYISAPTGLVGIFVSVGNADTLYHVLSDNLGSINAVINSETNEVSKYSYSAWGIPRDPDDWTSDLTGDLFAGRGFTTHEHLLEFKLINMNGRVYDPVLARFLSPDPFVQFPGMADGHNRYAYCLNNPLVYTDPSGYLTGQIDWAYIAWFMMTHTGPHGGTWKPGDDKITFYTEGEAGGIASDIIAEQGGFWRPGGGSISFSGGFEQISHVTGRGGGKSALVRSYIWRSISISFTQSNSWVWVSNWSAPNHDVSGLWGNTNNSMFIGTKGPGESSGVASSGGGQEFALRRMYSHFQFGGGKPMTINMSSIDFSGTSQRELGLKGMSPRQIRSVNLFNAGALHPAALAFGRVNMMYHGNNQFSIVGGNESSQFNFSPLIDPDASFGRNAGNILGATIN